MECIFCGKEGGTLVRVVCNKRYDKRSYKFIPGGRCKNCYKVGDVGPEEIQEACRVIRGTRFQRIDKENKKVDGLKERELPRYKIRTKRQLGQSDRDYHGGMYYAGEW